MPTAASTAASSCSSTKLDDQGIPTQDSDLARTLVTQDHVFAVVGVGTPFFSGAKYLAQQGTPTFGYEVSADWSAGPNLFGQQGSFIDFNTLYGEPANFAQAVGAHSVAVVAYGITASSAGCKLDVQGLQQFGVPVSYQDLAVGFGADLSPDVLQIKAHHADLVMSCLDLNGNIALEPGPAAERGRLGQAAVVQRVRPRLAGRVSDAHEQRLLLPPARALRSGRRVSRRVPGHGAVSRRNAEVRAGRHVQRGRPRRMGERRRCS